MSSRAHDRAPELMIMQDIRVDKVCVLLARTSCVTVRMIQSSSSYAQHRIPCTGAGLNLAD